MGGENLNAVAGGNKETGSSPRGRGKLRCARGWLSLHRLIPAWAGKTIIPIRLDEEYQAHPRVGGENARARRRARVDHGSSPRGRGKQAEPLLVQVFNGLIPAWAGKTSWTTSVFISPEAHPRVGGENEIDSLLGVQPYGSSPRGRGKLLPCLWGVPCAGLIPAWAGKTIPTSSGTLRPGAHPRVGGENRSNWTASDAAHGSSPRGRGKPDAVDEALDEARLIPAWAGKTIFVALYQNNETAHPRVGGENVGGPLAVFGVPGSSPRGRGKLSSVWDGIKGVRLIPAWAGKTFGRRPRLQRCWAHPRVGGENDPPQMMSTGSTGSSPRGRGKPHFGKPRAARQGLIPAWAGKTRSLSCPFEVVRAHPRVGGENLEVPDRAVSTSGSSPRGRGKRGGVMPLTAAVRLIPAWAGKTCRSLTTRSAGGAHPRVGGENHCLAFRLSGGSGSSPRGRGKLGTRPA